MYNLRYLLLQAIDLYLIIIVVRAVLSWIHINPYGSFFKVYLILIKVTEPVLGKVRELQQRFFPNSPIDFSPFIVILLLDFLKRFISGA